MAKANVQGCATIPVNGDGCLEKESHETQVTFKKLPKIEVRAEDRVYVYVYSKFQEALAAIKTLKPEVVMFVYMFAYIIRSVTSMSMIMHKSCKVNIGFDDEVCNNLGLSMFKEQKAQVEKMANNYHLYHTLTQLIPSIPLACFIGPWSDTYGRKAPIIVALIGIILDGIGAMLCAYYLDTGVQYYLVPAVFTGFSGGFISVLTVVYSYVSDTTSVKNRTFRYTTMEIAFGLGVPIGTLSGGWIFKYGGYVPVFLTSVIGHVLGLFWVIYMIEETRGLDNYDSWEVKVRNFVSFKRLTESFKAAIKPRPHHGRLQIWLLMFAMSMSILGLIGSTTIAYLYTYHHFGWSNTKYSTVSSLFSIMSLIVMLIAVPVFVKVLKLGDPTLGVVGNVAVVLKNTFIGLANREGGYYFGNFCGLFSGLASLAGRSRISKIVSKEDLGKVFAFLSTVESLVPVIAMTVVTQVFNKTIGMHPDPTFLGIAALTTMGLFVYIWLACLPKVNYEGEEEEKKEDEAKLEEPKDAQNIDLQSSA